MESGQIQQTHLGEKNWEKNLENVKAVHFNIFK